jgi:hypothetical protein
MQKRYYKTPNIGSAFGDYGGAFGDYDSAMRYLKGSDQKLIKEDDPDFFVKPVDGLDNISLLSSSRRILKKVPHEQKKGGALKSSKYSFNKAHSDSACDSQKE